MNDFLSGVWEMLNKGFLLILVVCVSCLSANGLLADSKPGLLVVHPENPRYLMVKGDPAKKAVLLTGAHTWAEFQTYKQEKFDYQDWISKLVSWNHNFMRGWTWEDDYYRPMPFTRTNGKYNLDQYNPEFFNRYKKGVEMAARKGIYVSVMLFQGWSVPGHKKSRKPAPWPRHPFHVDNNNNGINGDPDGDGEGKEVHTLQIPTVTALQEAYVKHFIDLMNGYDNIIWEIGNECNRNSTKWQYHMIDFIKSYEAKKPKQHLVWINRKAEEVFDPACHAEIVSPSGAKNYINNPPAATGKKVVIADSDHLSPLQVNHVMMWKNFARGNHAILMDCKYQGLTWWRGRGFQPEHPRWQNTRDALGVIQTCAKKMNLARMVPQQEDEDTPADTHYCLYNAGEEYLVYQPDRGKGFTLDLPAGEYRYEWINPRTGVVDKGKLTWEGGKKSFVVPTEVDHALYLTKSAKSGRVK